MEEKVQFTGTRQEVEALVHLANMGYMFMTYNRPLSPPGAETALFALPRHATDAVSVSAMMIGGYQTVGELRETNVAEVQQRCEAGATRGLGLVMTMTRALYPDAVPEAMTALEKLLGPELVKELRRSLNL